MITCTYLNIIIEQSAVLVTFRLRSDILLVQLERDQRSQEQPERVEQESLDRILALGDNALLNFVRFFPAIEQALNLSLVSADEYI